MASSTRVEWAWLLAESRPFVRYQIAGLTCIAASSASTLIQPLLMKWLIDDILPKGRWGMVALVALLFLVAGVGREVLSSLGSLVNMLGVRRMACCTQARIVRHIQSLSPTFHARHAIGDLLQRLERDVAFVGDLASDALPSIAQIVVGTLMAVVAMFFLDWRLSSVVLPLLPLFAYTRFRYRTTLRQCAESVREANGRQSSMLQEILAGAVQIQLLGAERRLAREYRRLSLRTLREQIRQRRSELIYACLSTSIIALATALIVGYGSSRVLAGDLTVGGLVAFYGYIGSLFWPLSAAVGLFARITRMHASIRRLIEIEQAPDVVPDAPDAVPLTASPRTLVCRNVAFDYARGEAVLCQTQFHVRAGDRVAIVGESGSGKSSLMKLLPRLYEPTSGSIELDGIDIRGLRLQSLRRAMSFVPQDPVLFRGTLRANLRYGHPAATQDDLDRAAWIACLTEVIDRLPRGWETELGPMGAGLSGGERQRVAIARALLQQRPILILDEAFSALDAAVERRLLSRLEAWAAGRMVILVSHRLATAQWADRVVVIHRGKVVEDACHEQLFRPGTYYDALWQSNGRQDDGVPVVGPQDYGVVRP